MQPENKVVTFNGFQIVLEELLPQRYNSQQKEVIWKQFFHIKDKNPKEVQLNFD